MAFEISLPDKDDPEFKEKLLLTIQGFVDEYNKPSKNFNPIQPPEDGNQHGDVFFDSEENKLKVVTPDGVKVVKYE